MNDTKTLTNIEDLHDFVANWVFELNRGFVAAGWIYLIDGEKYSGIRQDICFKVASSVFSDILIRDDLATSAKIYDNLLKDMLQILNRDKDNIQDFFALRKTQKNPDGVKTPEWEKLKQFILERSENAHKIYQMMNDKTIQYTQKDTSKNKSHM